MLNINLWTLLNEVAKWIIPEVDFIGVLTNDLQFDVLSLSTSLKQNKVNIIKVGFKA